MKNRIKCVFGLLLCLLVFPVLVNADMGAPMISEYDVRIKNPDGAKLYDWDGKVVATIPYDTVVTVTYDYESDGKFYGTVSYGDESGEIKLSETEIVDKEIDLSDFYKLDQPRKLFVFEDDCYMYNGPSIMYGKVADGEIPKGTVIEYEYYDDVWIYTEYNGVKGWLYNYNYNMMYGEEVKVADIANKGDTIYVIDNVEYLYESPNEETKIGVNISSGEVLEYKYEFGNNFGAMFYVSYDGKEGWLSTTYSKSFEDDEGAVSNVECNELMVIAKNGLPIYKIGGDVNTKTTKKVEYGTISEVKYSFMKDETNWYYIKNGDDWNWIAVDGNKDNLVSISWGAYSLYKTTSKLAVYESYDSSSAKIKNVEIKKGTELKVKYTAYTNDSWAYLEEYSGWVMSSKLEYIDYVETCEYKNDPVTDVEQDTEEEKDEDRENKVSPREYAIYAIVGAVVLALVVIVIIMLINKNKNKNKIKE